jgi:hypothetical protein
MAVRTARPRSLSRVRVALMRALAEPAHGGSLVSQDKFQSDPRPLNLAAAVTQASSGGTGPKCHRFSITAPGVVHQDASASLSTATPPTEVGIPVMRLDTTGPSCSSGSSIRTGSAGEGSTRETVPQTTCPHATSCPAGDHGVSGARTAFTVRTAACPSGNLGRRDARPGGSCTTASP